MTILFLTFRDEKKTGHFDVRIYEPDKDITIEFETIDTGRFFDNKYDYKIVPVGNGNHCELIPVLKAN